MFLLSVVPRMSSAQSLQHFCCRWKRSDIQHVSTNMNLVYVLVCSQSSFPPDSSGSLSLRMVTNFSNFVQAFFPSTHGQRSAQGKVTPPDSATLYWNGLHNSVFHFFFPPRYFQTKIELKLDIEISELDSNWNFNATSPRENWGCMSNHGLTLF